MSLDDRSTIDKITSSPIAPITVSISKWILWAIQPLTNYITSDNGTEFVLHEEVSKTKAAQAATSLAGYTTAAATAVEKKVAMITQEEEAISLALRCLLIALGVSEVVALFLLAYALYIL